MKKFTITLILILTVQIWGYSQTISAPEPKTFIESTNGQDGSGFVVSGFQSTDILLTSISLINPPLGTTFYLNRLDGLTPASGFTLTGNKTRLVVTGTMSSINIALANLKINTGITKGEVKLSVGTTINPVGYYYNGVNGHFYKPVTTGTYYKTARANSLLTTFKGQTGYLVTITSADEDLFIQANVPATNIWFACTDEVIDGRWVIDAGPEKGTVIKTSNPNSGNVVGQYNNWASGEPNGYNHGEDYAVTKWNGNKWNDLYNQWNNPYVIEYGTWSNPDDQTFTDFYTNSVSHSNGDILRLQFNFDFGNNVDETKFSTKMFTTTDNINYIGATTNGYKSLSGLGKVDMSNDVDVTTYSTGTKYINLTPGDIEFCVIYEYDATNKRYRIGLDSRLWQYTPNAPLWNDVKTIQLFDLYSGTIVPNSTGSGDVWWNEYWIYTDTQFDYTNSTYQANLRNGGGYYALKLASTFTFGNNMSYKQHSIGLSTTNNLSTLYDNIVTVSDVFIAFKELSNGGISGIESGNEFVYGIQYMNADVNGDNIFDFQDTYKLLQYLNGESQLVSTNSVSSMVKLIPQINYNTISKLNWNTQPSYLKPYYPISFNPTALNTYNVSVTWVGDINLSHSVIPSNLSTFKSGIQAFGIKSMNSVVSNGVETLISSEIIGDKVVVTLKLNPNNNSIVGTQYSVFYDTDKLIFDKVEYSTPITSNNFGSTNGSRVKVGSLIYDGLQLLDNKTEYKIIFSKTNDVKNVLGLIYVEPIEATNAEGKSLKITIL